MDNTFKTTNGLILSKKSRVKLSDSEITQLKEYTESDPAAFININHNTKLRRDSVLRVIERGGAEVAIAIRLRDFLKKIQDVTLEGAKL